MLIVPKRPSASLKINFTYLFEIKQDFLLNSCIFDLQYTIVSDVGINYFTFNLIRIKFTFY